MSSSASIPNGSNSSRGSNNRRPKMTYYRKLDSKAAKSRRASFFLLRLLGISMLGAGLIIAQSMNLSNHVPLTMNGIMSDHHRQEGDPETVVGPYNRGGALVNNNDRDDKSSQQQQPAKQHTRTVHRGEQRKAVDLTNSMDKSKYKSVSEAGVTGLDDPALYQTVDVKGDSSTATVMGMASGYQLHVYRRFVGSLRKSGFRGNIILGVAPDVDPAVLQYFAYRNVTAKILKWVDCTYTTSEEDKGDIFKRTTCSDPYPDIKIRWSRFPLQRDWLQECETCTGPVLIMDVRDAYFQDDPFGPGSGPIQGLQVFEEHPSQTTGHWLIKPIVEQCKGFHFIHTMLCSGTTIGTRAAMLKYLEVMYGEMKTWISTPNCRFNLNGDDQTIHNYLFYTGQLPFAKAIPNRHGIVNTVGVEGAQVFKAKRKKYMDAGMPQGEAGKFPYDGEDGNAWIGPQYKVANENGMFTQHDLKTISRVIHQFDRWGIPHYHWLRKQAFAEDNIPPEWAKMHPVEQFKLRPLLGEVIVNDDNVAKDAENGSKFEQARRKLVSDAGVVVSDPALYETVDLHGDSSTATVMGMATGYGLGIYQRFVGSLRKSGFKGNIILGVAPDVPQYVLDYFEKRGVTAKILKWVDCTYRTDESDKVDIFKKTQCSDPYPDIKIRWSRFPLQRDWLVECEACTGPVLIMDVRDSFFQLDPFGPGSGPITGLQVFEEHPSQTTSHWLVKPIVKKCKGVEFTNTMLCSGTTIGTRQAMIKYLEVMYAEMKVWINEPKCRFNLNGDDQTIHNYLYYTDQLPFATAIPNREEVNVTDGEGFFTQFDGTRSRVIHQFDRYGSQLGQWMRKQAFLHDSS
eukprot:scaffold978_cov164-Amphora_coffeaeformis.AAC.2